MLLKDASRTKYERMMSLTITVLEMPTMSIVKSLDTQSDQLERRAPLDRDARSLDTFPGLGTSKETTRDPETQSRNRANA
jgi:hypothetical protein